MQIISPLFGKRWSRWTVRTASGMVARTSSVAGS